MAEYTPAAEAVRERVIEQVRLSRIADQAWQNRRNDAEFQGEAERLADAMLAVAAPIIERETGERIAREIEDFEPEDRALVHMPDWREAMYDAARIARRERS